jgi:hypothetical protein
MVERSSLRAQVAKKSITSHFRVFLHEKWIFILGIIVCCINGTFLPLFSFLFTKVTTILQEYLVIFYMQKFKLKPSQTKDDLLDTAHWICIAFLGVAVVAGLVDYIQ